MKESRQHRVPTRRIPVGRIAAAILAVGGLSASAVASGTAGAATASVISTNKNAKFGTILVSGKTVYTLKASKTPCTAKCLKVWPEVLLPKGSKKAKAGNGVNAAKLGTVKRANGALQVTYSGKALYWFVGDKAAGQVHGNVGDTWGTWSVVVTAKPAQSSTGTSPGSGSGGGAGTGSGSGGSTAGTGGVSF
jgi:predicted lipoprotein with Yx(FWY)xxD motif